MKQTWGDSEGGRQPSTRGGGEGDVSVEPQVIYITVSYIPTRGSSVARRVPIAATRAASPAKLRFPRFVACDGFRWDDFGKRKVYVVKGKMSQALLRAVFIAKAFPGR